jgi:hypothetical protein
LDNAAIPEIVRAHTGMDISFEIRDDAAPNACIIPPQVDKNHPFYQEWLRPFVAHEGVTAIRSLGGSARAGVDRATGRVTGLYTKFKLQVYVTQGLLDSKLFTNGEVAAITMHELGHGYTYFEFLGNTFTANYVLACAVNDIVKTDDPREREVILVEAEKVLGVKAQNKDKLVAIKKEAMAESLGIVYLSELAEKSRHELGCNLYDIRSWEQLSDQFATRHGAGRDLVTALDKIYRTYGHPSTFGNVGFLSMEALKLLSLTATILVPIAIGAPVLAIPGIFHLFAITIICNPQEKVYDDPEDRVKTVRRQINEGLKQKDISAKQRKMLLDDLEIIEQVESGLNDRRNLNEFLWAKVFPWGKKSANQAAMMKELEELANNDMFVLAAKFKQGAANA